MGIMRKKAVLTALERLIDRLELVSSQPFRVQAYRRLLEVLTTLPVEAWQSAESVDNALQQSPGIGDGLRSTARDLYEQGTTALLEELETQVPESVLELRRLPGLGPKRVQELWRELGILSVDALEQAITRGKLRGRKGWTPALIERLLEGIRIYRSQRHLLLYVEALHLWEVATARLRNVGIRLEAVGELRRVLPLIERVEGILSSEGVPAAQAQGWRADTDGILRHPELPVQLHPVEATQWGLELLRLTGPESFWKAVRERLPAEAEARTEAEVFQQAGLHYILPAWRDWEDIMTLAEQGQLPEPLTEAHIRGSVHVHTTYSDGADSLEAMAEAARTIGWKWLGIADHSQRAAYARGLSPERLAEQQAEIRRLNAAYEGRFTLLSGIEADILPDGRLDYGEEIWQRLDYIVASVHEKLHMTKAEAMQRLERALENPYVRVLGHWTGRLLRSRPGYPIDESRILEICAARGVAIEFNANPYRMEIDWRQVREAARLGVRIILTTDAHAVGELDYWRSGLAVLQKGMLPPALLLNASEAPPFGENR